MYVEISIHIKLFTR